MLGATTDVSSSRLVPGRFQTWPETLQLRPPFDILGDTVIDVTPPVVKDIVVNNDANLTVTGSSLIVVRGFFSEEVVGVDQSNVQISPAGSASVVDGTFTLNKDEFVCVVEFAEPGNISISVQGSFQDTSNNTNNNAQAQSDGHTEIWLDTTPPVATIEIEPHARNVTITVTDLGSGLPEECELAVLDLLGKPVESIVQFESIGTDGSPDGSLEMVPRVVPNSTVELVSPCVVQIAYEGTYGGAFRAVVPAGTVSDRARNSNDVAVSATQGLATDTTPPAIASLEISPRNVTNADIAVCSVLFSEPVTGFNQSQIRLSPSGSATILDGTFTFSEGSSSALFVIAFTESSSGVGRVGVEAIGPLSDLAGNINDSPSLGRTAVLQDTASPVVALAASGVVLRADGQTATVRAQCHRHWLLWRVQAQATRACHQHADADRSRS